MSAGLAIQGITKNLVFSTRRTDKAVNHSENIAVSFGNADVATGQLKNAFDGVEALAKESKTSFLLGFKGAKESIKAVSDANQVLKSVKNIINFTADNINAVITFFSGVRVLTSKNKEETLTEEAPALLTMFAFEKTAANLLEMEKKIIDPNTGKKISKKRVAIYKSNPILKAQAEKIEKSINEYFATKKLFNKISMKHTPGICKGLLFVTASITGSELGRSLGRSINDQRRAKRNKKAVNAAQKIKFVSNVSANKQATENQQITVQQKDLKVPMPNNSNQITLSEAA